MPPRRGDKSVAVLVGDAIRARRLELGFTQSEVAERARLDPDYFGRVERAEKNVSVSLLVSIARSLATTASDLLDGVE